MSVAAVQTRNSANNTSSSVAISITTTAGNLLAMSTEAGAATTQAPTRTGEANNNAVAEFNVSSIDFMRGDYMMNIGGNGNSVTLSTSNGATWCKGCVTEFSGAKTSGALGATTTHNTATTGTTLQPGSITPTSGSALFTAAGQAINSSTAATIDSGFTVDETGGAGTCWDSTASPDGTGSAHHDNVAASATNPTWTFPGTVNRSMAMMFEFLAAAAAAGPSIQMMTVADQSMVGSAI